MPKKTSSARKTAARKKQYKVSGQVFNSNNEPVMDQEVLAVDVDLRGAAIYKTVSTVRELKANGGFDILGEAKTNADGYYEIAFTDEMYKRYELGLADVVVFAIDGDKIIARSKLATQKDYITNELTHWDIQLPDAAKRGVPEYTRLIQVLGPFLKENGLQLSQLSGSDDQIAFLAMETQQDQAHTSLAVQADKLRNDYPRYKFSAELFYGIGRQKITLNWVALLQESAQDLQTAIEQSIIQNIISPQDPKAVELFIRNAMSVALQHSTSAPETADFYKTIGFSVKDPALQGTFAQTYLQHNGDPQDFWNALSQKPGFTAKSIQSLQLTNQLSILTGQHIPLIKELQVNRKIKDPSDLLKLSTDDWNRIVSATGVPDSVPGDMPEDKASNYISGMQAVLNAAYPTQKIALMINNNQLSFSDANVKEKVAAFLTSAQGKGFDISASRVSDFNNVIKEIAGTLYDQVLQHVQLIQRVYQISPTPGVMNTLIAKGYTSAYHVASISQNTFINTETAELGGADVAFAVYNRARHQVMRAQHILLKVRDTQDKATPTKIITSEQQEAIRDYLSTLSLQQS
jgi:LysM repeat protein